MNTSLYWEDIERIAELEYSWDKFYEKTLLIAGASGMIGTFLVDVLMYRNKTHNMKCKVIAVGKNSDKAYSRFQNYWTSPYFKFIPWDITIPYPSKINNIDYIIHAASNTHPIQYANFPVETITTNVLGLKNLLDLTKEKNSTRLLFLSSVEVYGENRGDIEKFSEKYCGYMDCNTLRAGYPESKRLCEAFCQAYAKEWNIDFVTVRLARVFGSTMSEGDSKAIAQFIQKAIQKEDIILKSKGNQLYSYCYVADAVSGIVKVLLDGKCTYAYNIAGKECDMCLAEIAEYLADISETKVIFQIPENIEKIGYSTATKALLDISLAEELGYISLYNIKDGLKRTIEILK